MAAHPGATADVSLRDATASSAIERAEDVLRLHVKTVDVIEPAIVRLGHDR
jgi:hypothetical protein